MNILSWSFAVLICPEASFIVGHGRLRVNSACSLFTEQFSKALDMMNRAVSGHFQPGVKENIAYFTLTERRNIADTPGSRSNSPATSIPQTAPFEVISLQVIYHILLVKRGW